MEAIKPGHPHKVGIMINQWAEPPHCILDTGRYHLDNCSTEADTATIKMTSPSGSPTGVQITRQASIRPEVHG